MKSFIEYTLECIEKGKIQLDPDIVTEKVTYHDPCNIARSGWIVEQPREILRSFVKDFVEMTPHGRANYCCGGGGGLVSMDETHEFRMKVAGRVKADQIRATGAEHRRRPLRQLQEAAQGAGGVLRAALPGGGPPRPVLRAIDIPGGKSARQRQDEAALAATA